MDSSHSMPDNSISNEAADNNTTAQFALQQQVDRLYQQLSECERHAEQERIELLARVKELESQLAVRQTLNNRQRSDIESLQEQLERQQLETARESRQGTERYEQLQAELVEAQDVAQKRVETVQRFKAELSLSRTSVMELQTELNALKQQVAGERSAWVEQRELIEAQLAGYEETEAESLQRWQAEREVSDRELGEQRQQLQELGQQQQEWQQRCEAAEQQWAEAENLLGDRDRLQTQNQLLAEQSEHLQAQNQSLAEQVEQLQVQLRKQEVLAGVQEQLQASERRNQELLKEASEARSLLPRLDEEVACWKEKFASLQMQHMRLKSALERSMLDRPSSVKSVDEKPATGVAVQAAIEAKSEEMIEGRSGADLPGFIQQRP